MGQSKIPPRAVLSADCRREIARAREVCADAEHAVAVAREVVAHSQSIVAESVEWLRDNAHQTHRE